MEQNFFAFPTCAKLLEPKPAEPVVEAEQPKLPRTFEELQAYTAALAAESEPVKVDKRTKAYRSRNV